MLKRPWATRPKQQSYLELTIYFMFEQSPIPITVTSKTKTIGHAKKMCHFQHFMHF